MKRWMQGRFLQPLMLYCTSKTSPSRLRGVDALVVRSAACCGVGCWMLDVFFRCSFFCSSPCVFFALLFCSSFSLDPRRNSGGVTKKALSAPPRPHHGTRLHFYHENTSALSSSLTTVAPPTFLERNRRFQTSSRPYLLKYGVPRHPDVIDR